LHELPGIASIHLNLSNSRSGIAVFVRGLHLGNDFEREFRQTLRDFEPELGAV
jgi:hypothetical protein